MCGTSSATFYSYFLDVNSAMVASGEGPLAKSALQSLHFLSRLKNRVSIGSPTATGCLSCTLSGVTPAGVIIA